MAALLAHPRHLVLAALVAGLLAGPRAPAAAWWGGTALVAVAAAAVASAGALGSRAALPLALAGAAAPLGAWATAERVAALDRSALGPWLGHAVDVRAVVLQPPRPRAFGRWVALAVIRAGPGAGERVLVATDAPPRVPVGAEVRVRGGLRELPPFEAAMRRAGAHALLAAAAVSATGARRGGVLGAVDTVRERAERALGTTPGPGLAGLARGMVLGQDHVLTPRMTEDFRASGLAHLVAASGANVALLVAFVLALGALLGLPRLPRLGLALVTVAGYVPLAGGGPSIVRAGIMGAATLVAALASRAASRWYALLLAAVLTLALQPRAAEDPGWQLSFAAVAALLVLTPPLRSGLARRMPETVADALAICLAASAGTAPLIALHFGRLSWVTVPANLLALPAVAPVMWLGTAAGTVGQLAPGLAAPLTTLAAWPLAFVAWVARWGASLPGADTEVQWRLLHVVVWAVALAALAVAPVRARLARTGRRGVVAALAAALLGAGALARAERPPAAPAGLRVVALDVGQGDATLIQHGHHAMLVDAGPPDGPILERLEAAGVERLDLLVVTHAQADHEGGAAAVIAELPVGLVLDGRDGVRTADGARWVAEARRRRVRLVPAAAGQRLRVGPMLLDVLWPRVEPASLHAGEDPNQRAVVAELRSGRFSMLLAADAESDVLNTLPLETVDVLKVAHHGSADPGLPELLRRVRPHTAIIEVGRRNRYGHPAPETLAALRVVPRVHRTDLEGTVTIQPDP